MRVSACLGKTVLLLAVFYAPSLHAEQGLLTFVFGPSSPEAARQSARAAAATARHWVQTDGVVELRRGGSQDVQRIDAATGAKDVDQKFGDAILAARDTDPASFLITLDSAAQAAATHSGTRVVVAVLNSPSFSSDGERTLEHLGEICQAHGVRVLVLDVAEGAKTIPNAALKALAAKSGGAWMRQAKDLGPQVAMVTPPDEPTLPPTSPAPVEAAAKAAEATPSTPGAAPKSEIPVLIRFMRTAGTGSTSESITNHEADFGTTATLIKADGTSAGGGGSMEVAFAPSDPNAPLQGLVTVESPLKALKFDMDDNTGTYQARARITAIVRNVKGAAIWTGRKEVNVRGPAQKLKERREGSMFFMRAVTLVGQGPFTLEAKVEDLLGHTTGVIQTPLRVGRNAPGLVATDAVVVRPLKGSADKFEADQVLSYEGEALSPVLDPVFQAGQEFKLQLYVILYPDIHGAQPDMSLELAREGHVVVRMPMQFSTKILDPTRDGKANQSGGLASSGGVIGGQSHAFPYLADVNGTKLAAGNYEAIVTIRQGKSVITRNAPFRVLGDRPVAAEAAPDKTLVKRTPAEDGVVVLPEIEPATIDSSGLAMAQDEQKRLWDEAAANAREYSSHLPNFRCAEETHRFTGPAAKPDELKETDSFRDELTFEEGRETYRVIEINGTRTEASRQDLNSKVASSKGEFGSMLMGLFDPEVGATYKWAGRAMAMGVLCQVFDITVPRAKSNFTLTFNRMGEPAGYTGKVFVDDETGLVRRLTILGDGLPPTFPLQAPSFSLEYGMVRIGSVDYLLPLRSTMQVKQGKNFVRNESVFREYRRFEASSGIKFDNK